MRSPSSDLRRRSPSLISPTSVPSSSTTGRPLTCLSSMIPAARLTLLSGETETTFIVITSLTFIALSFFSRVTEGLQGV